MNHGESACVTLLGSLLQFRIKEFALDFCALMASYVCGFKAIAVSQRYDIHIHTVPVLFDAVIDVLSELLECIWKSLEVTVVVHEERQKTLVQ